jgi:hypothetical protein
MNHSQLGYPKEILRSTKSSKKNGINLLQKVPCVRVGVHTISLNKVLIDWTEQELKKALAWLKAPDFQANHGNARALEQEGTGQWFVQGKAFRAWLEGSNRNLWVQGIRKLIASDHPIRPAYVAAKPVLAKLSSGESTPSYITILTMQLLCYSRSHGSGRG